MTDLSGSALFSRFAFPPNSLGYCGPSDTGLLKQVMVGGLSGLEEMTHIIPAFAGAWPYLELIGACANRDPLDPGVVEAYWLGNPLLDQVDLLMMGNSLDERFRHRAGWDWSAVSDALNAGGKPNHSFHVFCIYPWVGLLRSGSIEGIVEAGAALLADLGSREPSARASAAEVLRDAAIPSFHRHVGRLLEDPDPAVRARALEAAGATDRPELWARVVEALRDPNLLPIASRVLLGAAGRAVPALTAALARERGERGFRLSAIRVLGLHEGPEAAAALVSVSGTVDREERTVALAALARRARDLDGRRIGWLETALGVELAETAEAFATQGELADLESGGEVAEAAGTLRNAVEEDIRSARRRIFHILSLLKPGADLATAWESYDSGSRSRRAYALELLDGHLRTDERAAVFPLLEELASDERLAAIRRSRDLPRLPAERRLERLIADPGASAWTRLCARRLRVALASAAGPGGPSGVAATEAGDDALADETLTEAERRLYDRTRRLGAVELFRDLPAATLSRIVPRLQHMTAAPGTAIVREGEPGDGLYVVLEGRVRVHDGGRELAVLGGDAVFGEFTVLQRSPRTATVTAIEESGLLKLTQDDLLELMREHASVARTLIRVILRRLRENRESRRSGEAVSPDGPAAPR